MLPTNDLTMLKTVSESTLTEVVTVYRAAGTDNGMGGTIDMPKTLVITSKGRIAPLRDPSDRIIAEKFAGDALHVVWMPIGTDVQLADEVRIHSRVLVAVGLADRTNATLLKVICKETL